MFYFAWVNRAHDIFLDEYARQDEDVFSMSITHREGEFPIATVLIRNPRVGLLSPGRKQYVWISQDSPDSAGYEGLFFGRIAGVPTALGDNVVQIIVRARPYDVRSQKETLAATLKVRPYWDAMWIRPELRDEPDTVLEGRTQLWHFDRLSPTVSVSDIIEGEDGTEVFDADDIFEGSLGIAIGEQPLRTVRVEAEVFWTQKAKGEVDITKKIVDAFHVAGSRHANHITSFTGQGLYESWPAADTQIGSGWYVKTVNLTRVDGVKFDAEWKGVQCQYWREPVAEVEGGGKDNDDGGVLFRKISYTYSGSGGSSNGYSYSYARMLQDPVDAQRSTQNNANRPVTARFLLWEIKPRMVVGYDVERQRNERVIFSLSGDVQSLYTDAEDDDKEVMVFSSGEVGERIDEDGTDTVRPIRDLRRSQFFPTDRGLEALEFLIAVARARMLARARAVQLTIGIPFQTAARLSCRKNATIIDPSIPGGTATGKIVSYSFSVDGDGNLEGSVTIACCIGKGNTVSAAVGEPSYVEDGYVEDGYVQREGVRIVPITDEIYYEPPTDAANDDGVDFFNMTADNCVESVTVTNGETAQNLVLSASFRLVEDAVSALNEAQTTVSLILVPLAVGPFEQTYRPTVSDLMIPKTIDLEAA